MKKLVRFFVSLLLAFSIGASPTVYALAAATIQTQTQSVTPKPKPTFMFTLFGKAGVIKKTGKNSYVLSMQAADVEKVTVFSNEPGKAEQSMSLRFLQEMWTSKVFDNFKTNPPNSTLSLLKLSQPAVVVVTEMATSNGLISFSLKSNEPLPTGLVTKISLVFDGIQLGLRDKDDTCIPSGTPASCFASECYNCKSMDFGCNVCWNWFHCPTACA